MKKIILASAVLGMVLASGCNRPKERASIVNPAIAANLLELKNVSEITSATAKNIYVKGGKKDDITKMNDQLTQLPLEASAAETILKKVTLENTKKAVEDQLKTGAIALVVLKDQIKVLKVVPDTQLSMSYDVLTLAYMAKMKEMSKSSDIQAQSVMARQLEEMKLISPAAKGEKNGLVEITAINIKVGTLDNDKNDYQEKKSTLSLVESPLEVATHIVLGSEVGAKPAEDEAAPAQ